MKAKRLCAHILLLVFSSPYGRKRDEYCHLKALISYKGHPKPKVRDPALKQNLLPRILFFSLPDFLKNECRYPIAASLSYDFDCPFKENNAFVSPLRPPLQKCPPPPLHIWEGGGGQPDRREYRGDLEPALWHSVWGTGVWCVVKCVARCVVKWFHTFQPVDFLLELLYGPLGEFGSGFSLCDQTEG